MLPSILMLAALAQAPSKAPCAPNEAYEAALLDLSRSDPSARPYLRYLALYAVPEDERELHLKALAFWCNSLSWRRSIVKLAVLPADGPPELVRIDLREFAWDRHSRADRLRALAAAGVKVGLGGVDNALYLDPWELLATRDPYFGVTRDTGGGVIERGWLDPEVELAVRSWTYSRKAVLRADWFLAQTALDVPDGVYSVFLFHPDNEAALFDLYGVDRGRVDREYLTRGGAVLRSIVALHNRELQLFPSLYGRDRAYLWRSLDVESNQGGESVLRNFLGDLEEHSDGHELIGSLPNGLHWYWIGNGQGNQAFSVPDTIAQDHQDPHDSRVVNPYKCVGCHTTGILHFDDVVGELALRPGVALASVDRNQAAAIVRAKAIEDYYLSELGRTIEGHNEDWSARIAEANGMESPENAANFIARVNAYLYNRLSPGQVALELGCDAETAAAWLRGSGEAEALALSEGLPIARDAWESIISEVMKSRPYPWESEQ